ncbi:hypothetical protein LWI28_009359 [Acer negundo]|uniref:Uncharacterized protein n=1 Tax=Acer negundo TaxID=4023 RepID=A0AAD5I669_ACENE|nr:hypothetical protein LWI28_009359 [Acer negundo]KAK4834390.1 hypothetical protein QYF36_021816 [Acer negundo]
MELKSTTLLASLFILFLLSSPKGGSSEVVVVAAVDSHEVYEIDYKGPETHASIPPPDHSRGKPMNRHEATVDPPPKCKGLRGCNVAPNEKKIHG